LNQDYVIEEVNQTFLQQFGKKSNEVVGRFCYQIFHQLEKPCDQNGLVCPLPQVLVENRTVNALQHFPNAAGCSLYTEITMSPLCPPEGQQKRVIEVIKDVTARQQLEQALQTSEEQTRRLLKQANKGKKFLETIVNGIEDQMMVIDLNYRIIEVNRALLKMVGLRREDVVGMHCYEVSHHLSEPCSSPDHPCPLNDAVATRKAASTTHVHFAKDGREHYIHVVCHPLIDEDGKVNQVIDLSRDITKEVTARTRMLHDDKMSSLGKLSASVVHEINNPLTGILNFIKLMQRLLGKGKPSETDLANMQNYLEMVHNETSRVSKTVSNLLAFSRKTKPEFTQVNLNDLLEETIALTEYQMRFQGITVQRQTAPNLLPVNADPAQLKQALLNLILNAQDAMPKGGNLIITTRNRQNREVQVKISDTGVGIPKESFSHIFEPFYTTKKAGGVGLGLSVVYGIVRDHKGFIKVDSVVGQGTTFSISLPAWKSGVESAAA
jgi:PAS domain S-box-containing protein